MINVKSRVHPEQDTHKVKGHLQECNILWTGFLRQLREDEMSFMEGSPYLFLRRTADFLTTTPYQEAQAVAASMAEDALKNIKISVVIPFYNRVELTLEAIHSVQAQTHQNFEILLVDDGSTDELAVLFECMRLDSRIKYIRQENAGSAKARNAGIEAAAGRYIAFLDSDDLFCPQKLEQQLKYMEENGFLLSHTSYHRMDFEHNSLGVVHSASAKNIFPGIIASCPVATPTVMGRTDVFINNLFLEQFKTGEDVCLWITLASKYHFAGYEQPLSEVRVGETSSSVDVRKQMIGFMNIASFLIHDQHLCKYERQIKSLLLDAMSLLGDTEPMATGDTEYFSPNTRKSTIVSLISKGLVSLKVLGIKETWRLVLRCGKGRAHLYVQSIRLLLPSFSKG